MGSIAEEPRFEEVPFTIKSDVVPRATGHSAQEAEQSRFLQRIAESILCKVGVSREQECRIEALRRSLELRCQVVIGITERELGNKTFKDASVKLEVMGSHKSGFASNESGLDLILLSPQSTVAILAPELHPLFRIPGSLQAVSILSGYGARLTTRSRELVLQGCQSPTDRLKQALSIELNKIEENIRLNDSPEPKHPQQEVEQLQDIELVRRLDIAVKEGWIQEDDELAIFQNFKSAVEAYSTNNERSDSMLTASRADLWALKSVLARYHEPEDPNLKIPKSGVGIKWTIHFAPEPVRFSTQMLWCYGNCEPRVLEFVRFIKTWAKRRDINDTQRGTLSSYGYTLMALHFLMNVVQPPVLPNLQQEFENFKRDNSGYEKTLLEVMENERAVYNNESIGSLLRGFFAYFNNPKAKIRKDRFTWGLRAISIRTPGGIVTKQSKGWTSSEIEIAPGYFPWEEPFEIRHRHLLSIEDPFETDLDIGYTVSYPGMCKMKDEFKRAHRIVENLGKFPDNKIMDLMEVTNHSDLDRPWLYFGKQPSKENSPKSTFESVHKDLSNGNEVKKFRSLENGLKGELVTNQQEPESKNGYAEEKDIAEKREAEAYIQDKQSQEKQVIDSLTKSHLPPSAGQNGSNDESSSNHHAPSKTDLPNDLQAQKSSQHQFLRPIPNLESVSSSLHLANLWPSAPEIINHPNLTGANQPLGHGNVPSKPCKPINPTKAQPQPENKKNPRKPSIFQTLREMAVKPNESLRRIGLLTGSEAEAGVSNMVQAMNRTWEKQLEVERERKRAVIQSRSKPQINIRPLDQTAQASQAKREAQDPTVPGAALDVPSRGFNRARTPQPPAAVARGERPSANSQNKGNTNENANVNTSGLNSARRPPAPQAPVNNIPSQSYGHRNGRGNTRGTNNRGNRGGQGRGRGQVPGRGQERGGRTLGQSAPRVVPQQVQQSQVSPARGVRWGGLHPVPHWGRGQYRGRGQVRGSGVSPGRGAGRGQRQEQGQGGLFRSRGGVRGGEWV
ncbi:hypothetical protein MMC10_008397 [Thelotrema lepadinum]|nr:hypothetical protein [Thelotrema lepadinum]